MWQRGQTVSAAARQIQMLLFSDSKLRFDRIERRNRGDHSTRGVDQIANLHLSTPGEATPIIVHDCGKKDNRPRMPGSGCSRMNVQL